LLDNVGLLRDKFVGDVAGLVYFLETVLPTFDIPPAKRASDVAPSKRSRLYAEVALYSEVMFVTLPAAAGPEALGGPVTGFVRGVLELADQNFSFRQVHRWDRIEFAIKYFLSY
jgi:hypothetical protein